MSGFTSHVGKGEYASPHDLLDTFHKAADTANLGQYFGCFAEDATFLGTDAQEHWTVSEFYEYARPHFLQGKGWSYSLRAGTRKISIHYSKDRVPLFASFDELLNAKGFSSTLRGTGTLCFNSTTKTWLIFSYYLSFAVPNDIASKISTEIGDFERQNRSSLQDTTSAAPQEGWSQFQEKCRSGLDTFGGFEPTVPPPSEESISLLMGLGFTRAAVITALQESENDVDIAANILLR